MNNKYRDKKGRFVGKSLYSFQKRHKRGMYGKHHSEETRRKMREAHKGNSNFKGKHHTEKEKKRRSESMMGEKNPMFGKTTSEKQKRAASEMCKKRKGENSPVWKGGKSFEPYGLEFNEDLREVIRNRDRRKCMLCEKTELENKAKLTIHHIDYCKTNNDPKNLISLCKSCNSKVNKNRDYWINYFKKKICFVS